MATTTECPTTIKWVQAIFFMFVFAVLGIFVFGIIGNIVKPEGKLRNWIFAGIALGGITGFYYGYKGECQPQTTT